MLSTILAPFPLVRGSAHLGRWARCARQSFAAVCLWPHSLIRGMCSSWGHLALGPFGPHFDLYPHVGLCHFCHSSFVVYGTT